jgi:hypothetical protein
VVDVSSAVHESSPAFGDELTELCKVLEKWRAHRKALTEADSDDFPAFDRRAGWQSLIFYTLYGCGVLLWGWYISTPQAIGRGLVMFLLIIMLISGAAGTLLLLIKAVGLGKAQFWRTLYRVVTMKDKYPFSNLTHGIKTDIESSSVLVPYATSLLVVLYERIGLEEADLRERINVVIGNPTILVFATLVTAIWTSWQGFRGAEGILSWLPLLLSIMAFALALYGARLRFSLFELAHCRLLLSLEIARRKLVKSAG